ncbi:MAG: hypothetical protein M3174_08065 [Actinomycetota bacterium]|nr:hypothetical protein [Actinomycetota bacterium]
MMRRRFRLLAVPLMVFMMLGAGVAGAQTDAGDDPTVRGPLSRDEKDCVRDADSTTSGVRAVVSKACSYSFAFNPNRDLNPSRDYGVFWFQTTVDPKNGFCVSNVTAKIRVPRGYRIEGKTPNFERTNSRERDRAKLRVDAGGGRGNDAIVKNSYVLFPRTLKPNLERRRLKVEWNGGTRNTVAVFLGVEVSYREGNIPTRTAEGSVESELRSSC